MRISNNCRRNGNSYRCWPHRLVLIQVPCKRILGIKRKVRKAKPTP